MQSDLGRGIEVPALSYGVFALRSGLQPHKARAASGRAVASFSDWLKMLPMVWDGSRFATLEL